MKKLLIIILAILLITPAGIALAIADPDTAPQVSAVYVYHGLLEDDDIGVLIDYYLDYAVLPSETVNEAYLAIFTDIDGVTQLKAVAPYAYNDKGYGRGLVWIYFSAAEVTTYGITSDNETLYRIWLVGNPTLSWSGVPPKTVASIDYWQPDTASASTLLALRILYYADVLETAWTIDLIEDTPVGNKLTGNGESYFTNVITSLRTMAPLAFSTGEYDPVIEDIDYTTAFGATMVDETGTVIGSPITLTEGLNTVDVTATGTFTLELSRGTTGNVTDGTGTVTGSPASLVSGTNTITTTVVGTLIVAVELSDTITRATDTVIGTGLDLTEIAARFGMSRWMFSGLVWLVISVVVCAAVYKKGTQRGYGAGKGKTMMLVFDTCIVGGTVLGLLHPLVVTLLFIGFGAFTGYVLFFRGASV